MIDSYLDESFDPKDRGVFAVGGILGNGRAMLEIDRKWEQLRKSKEIDIAYFKASECQLGKKQFAKFVKDSDNITPDERVHLDSIWDKFLDVLIGRNPETAIIFGVGVIQEDFYEVINEPSAKAILGVSPYWLAYQMAMITVAFGMKKLHQEHKIHNFAAFVCDEDEEHSNLAPDVYCDLKQKNPRSAQYMGSFTSKSDHLCEPLQAADAAIYEVRRALHSSLGRWKWDKSLRWQFRRLADAKRMWLIQYADKKISRISSAGEQA